MQLNLQNSRGCGCHAPEKQCILYNMDILQAVIVIIAAMMGGFATVIGIMIRLYTRNRDAIERVEITVSRIEGYIEGKEGRPYVSAAKRNATANKRR